MPPCSGSVLCLATFETNQKKLSLYMNTYWALHNHSFQLNNTDNNNVVAQISEVWKSSSNI